MKSIYYHLPPTPHPSPSPACIHLPFVSPSHELISPVGFLLSLIRHVCPPHSPPPLPRDRDHKEGVVVHKCASACERTEAPARRSINMFLSACECCRCALCVCVCVVDVLISAASFRHQICYFICWHESQFSLFISATLILNLLLLFARKVKTHTHTQRVTQTTFGRYINDGCHGDHAWLCL